MRWCLIFYLFILPALSIGQPVADDSDTSVLMTLFSEVNVVDVATGHVLPNKDVMVQNGLIRSIKNHATAANKQKSVVVIHGKGQYLMPGLIDCHTHIFYKEDLAPYLRNGVTTVFSLGQPNKVLEYRKEIQEGVFAGPTIYAAALIDEVPQDWDGSIYNFVVHSPADVDTAMKAIRLQQYDIIKAYNSLTTPEFDELMRLAKLYQMPVIGHGVRKPGMEHILSHGMAMVAHGEEYLYTVFNDSLDERKIPAAVAFTKKYGAFVCPNLSTFHSIMMQWGDSLGFAKQLQSAGDVRHSVSPNILQFWTNNNRYIHREGAPLVPMYSFLQKLTLALYKAGVPLVAGTDSPIIPGCFPGYSLVTELQLLTEAGIPAADALKIATLTPGKFIARYMPQQPKTGIIKAGYKADLLLLSNNPMQDVKHIRNIEGVMANGRWYPKER